MRNLKFTLIIAFYWLFSYLASIFIFPNSSINDLSPPDFIKEYSKSETEPQKMPSKWFEIRNKLKQTYTDKNTKIKGFTHQEVISWNKEAIKGNQISLERSDDPFAPPSNLQLSITQILPEFEIKELTTGNYPEVWFTGTKNLKKNSSNESDTARNRQSEWSAEKVSRNESTSRLKVACERVSASSE